jgi:hypothetical protein
MIQVCPLKIMYMENQATQYLVHADSEMGSPDFFGGQNTKTVKIYQITTKYNKRAYNIFKMAVK